MKVVRAKTKQALIEEIKTIDSNDDEFYLNLRPTADILDALMEKNKNLKRVCCPPSLLQQTARKVFKLTQDKGIKLEAGDFKVGRPKKYDEDTIREVVESRNNGKPAKEIASELEMPLRTVYFYIKNGNQE
jgi:hypothetical protein